MDHDRGAAVVAGVASDWLRGRLGRSWASGAVVGVTPRAAYVRLGPASPGADGPPGGLLALEGPGAVGLPTGIDLASDTLLQRLRVGSPALADATGVRLGADRVAVRRWRRSRPVFGTVDADLVRSRLDAMGLRPDRTVPSDWPDPPGRLRDGVAALAAAASLADVDAVVERLLGWGGGSTPAGDDVLAGWIATVVVLGPGSGPAGVTGDLVATVRARAPGATTALSATLLDAAGDGAVARPAARVLERLAGPAGDADDAVWAALSGLATVGHTSGRDLACGMLGAAAHLVAGGPPA